jgi:HK97 family phage major capsid protein
VSQYNGDGDQVAELLQRAGELRQLMAEQNDLLAARRTPSKAHLIGSPSEPRDDPNNFFALIARASSARIAGPVAQQEAKAALEDLGVPWRSMPAESKATVGDSDGAGGYLIPNPVVAAINLQATPKRGVVDLFTNVPGVRGSAVDIPWEQVVESRAVIAASGATKENANFLVNNYTATLYTLARIFDVGNQLLRQSDGAAEFLVRSKLARAFALGEDFYALSGTGSSQPYGLLTAIGTSGTYVTTFSSPADTTVAGSVAAAAATALGDLENRGAEGDGIVMNTVDYWRMRRQGSDTAGFWVDPTATDGGRALTLFGLPVRHTPNIASDTLVVGEFKAVQFFKGQGYRVDVSSEAADRWDKNLTGFRGEEEIAMDARPAVYAGKFQRIVNAVGA